MTIRTACRETTLMSDTDQHSIVPQPKHLLCPCPKCSGAMKWFSSQIKSGSSIEHRFACDQCGFLESRLAMVTPDNAVIDLR
jgi:predicted RNA-binding Zn-ribbon protein involved in translation (DUF1610 family)